MAFERIYKQEDGSRLKFRVSVSQSYKDGGLNYYTGVEYCAPGKRKFTQAKPYQLTMKQQETAIMDFYKFIKPKFKFDNELK